MFPSDLEGKGYIVDPCPEACSVSMLSICRGIFKEKQYEDLLAVNMKFASCGRATETGATNYFEMGWDGVYNCVVATWFQSKTLGAVLGEYSVTSKKVSAAV